MLIAVQSPNGTKRIECKPGDSTASLMRKIQSAFNLEDGNFEVYKRRNKDQILSLERRPLSIYKLKHGDTVYMTFKDRTLAEGSSSESPMNSVHSESQGSVAHSSTFNSSLPEDEVDTELFKENGYIQRPRDEKLCQHVPHGKCVHCIPFEPYDEEYLRSQNIKHMSFHSYLRKLTGGVDKGKFAALENISCKIKPGCKEHSPWPQGICTKCQPNAITLNRQRYRHVDNVVFENPFVVDRFLDYWRCTGHQRIGYLYGKYEVHKDVPLGIKATVAAIYEPPQDGSQNTIKLLPDEKELLVNKIAASLGLKKIGWIFTDLIPRDVQKGTVKHLRNASSYFLSAQECIMAGHLQNQHPNPCKLSPDGYFGSKFVTVCVTGDADNHIHMEGYQVSNQCMALVRDKCLVPTIDAPELGYVRESSNAQYVPDVFYKDKDSYGNEIIQLARPLPIEYLIIDVPVSTPVDPQFTFYADSSIKPFPVENRMVDGYVQDFGRLSAYLQQFSSDKFLEALSDFHVLIYIATTDSLPLQDCLEPLLQAVRTKNVDLAKGWSSSDEWCTVERLMDHERSMSTEMIHEPSGAASSGNSASALWICKHCTFLNQPDVATCEMCGLPQ